MNGRPLITLPAGPIYTESGKDVKLPKCWVIGYPPPVVSWTKLFDQLPGGRATVQGHTLTITKTDKKDAGTYICHGYERHGYIARDDSSDSQRRASVYCQATREDSTVSRTVNGHPVPSITWARCKGSIPEEYSQVEGGQLKIDSLTAEDSGTYICSARSEFVHVETEVQLIVKT
ncbi:G2F domain, partial [Desmophyllum pertusum]